MGLLVAIPGLAQDDRQLAFPGAEGYGRYTDINSKNFFARCIREEYYTTQYSKEDLEPIMVSKKIDYGLFDYIFNWEEVDDK